MSITRNIVRGVKIEVADRVRKCHASKSHIINPGETHIAVYEGAARANICLTCGQDVLGVAIAHLQKRNQQLYS